MQTSSVTSGKIATERLLLALGVIGASIVGVAALFTPYPALAPILAISFVAGLFVIRFPELAVYGLIIGVFFTGGDNPLSALRIHGSIKLVAPVLLIFAIARSITAHGNRLSSHQKLALCFAVMFCGYAIISWISGPDTTDDASFLLVQRLVISVSLFSMIILLKDRLKIEWLIVSIVIGAAFSCLLTLPLDTAHPENGREAGFLGDPNLYSAYLVTSIPIAASFYFRSRNPSIQFIALLIVGLIAYTTLNTGSRAGLVVCVFGIVASFAVSFKSQLKNLKQLAAIAVVLIAGFAVVVLPQASKIFDRSGSTEIQTSLGEVDRSTARRLSYIEVGVKLIVSEPLLGNGLGSFPKEFANSNQSKIFMTSKELFPLFRRAHNSYLEVLAELGLLGFSLFAGIHLVSLLTLTTASKLTTRNLNNHLPSLETFLTISLVSMWIMMITLSIYEMYMLWVICAICLLVRAKEESHG